MSKSKHTPGPWCNEPMDIPFAPRKIAGADYGIAIVYGTAGGKAEDGCKVANKTEGMANARLMAAAPDMYDVLNRISGLEIDADSPERNTEKLRRVVELAGLTISTIAKR